MEIPQNSHFKKSILGVIYVFFFAASLAHIFGIHSIYLQCRKQRKSISLGSVSKLLIGGLL